MSTATEAPDEASAMSLARGAKHRVEVLAGRTESSQVFAQPDGTFAEQTSLRPQRVHRADGTWVAADPTLHRNADGSVSPAAAIVSLTLSGGGTAPFARMSRDGREMTLGWPGTLPAPTLSGDQATYPEVLPGVDLVVEAAVDGFTHTLVIKTPQAAANPAVKRIQLSTGLKGLSLRTDGSGAVSAVDAAGKTFFGGGVPQMWDSASAEAPSRGAAAATPLTAQGKQHWSTVGAQVGSGGITLVPDAAMLARTDLVYPLRIDPNWQYSTGLKSSWATVSTNAANPLWNAPLAGSNDATAGEVKVGRSPDGFTVRELFNMDVSAVRSKHINSATFSLDERWSSSYCGDKTTRRTYLWSTNAATSSLTWNTSWNSGGSGWHSTTGYNDSLKFYNSSSCPAGRVEFNATSAVIAASNAGATTVPLGMRASSETDTSAWKKFKLSTVQLTVEYNSYPDQPSALDTAGTGCVTGAARPVLNTSTPRLSARVSDKDAQELTARFYWWPLGGARSDANMVSAGSTNPATAFGTIPAGKLADGGTYVWQAVTYDGFDVGQASGTCEFSVDTTAPALASGVQSTDYPAVGGDHGGVGRAGTFTFQPPAANAADVYSYQWALSPDTQLSDKRVVTADPATHTATVTITPTKDIPDPNELRVWTRDKAGNTSATPFIYQFGVAAGSGPAAQWEFDEATGSTADDASGHGNPATVVSAGWTTGRGGVGGALLLDGVGGHAQTLGPVSAPTPASATAVPVRTDANFSVTAWARLDAADASVLRGVVSQDGTRTSAFTIGYSGPDNRWRFSMNGSDVDAPSIAKVFSTAAPTVGLWTHLAGTYDASTHTLTFFVNGVQQGTAVLTGGFNATGNVMVGRTFWAGGPVGHFKGAVDEAMIYDRVITADELADVADPLAPTIAMPSGTTVWTGHPLALTFSSGNDANVTSYRFSVGDASLTLVATPSTPGGPATATYTPTQAGDLMIFAVGLTASGLRGAVQIAFASAQDPPKVTGHVTDSTTGTVAAGVTVSLDPGGVSTTTAADGSYSLIPPTTGTYTLSATTGSHCPLLATTDLDIEYSTTVDLALAAQSDAYGYTCTVGSAPFTPADTTVLPITGDDQVMQLALPFAFPYYGTDHSTAWLDTNGAVYLTQPRDSYFVNAPLPSGASPNNLIAPFWADIRVDASASMRSTVTGTAPNRKLVIEWRNVYISHDPALTRFTFEAILGEDGTITFNYSNLTAANTQGTAAVVGIESPGGHVGLQYSAAEAVLAANTAITVHPPVTPHPLPSWTLSGTATLPGGAVAAGADVWMEPMGVHTTTDASGHYQYPGLETGDYTVTVSQDPACGPRQILDVDVESDTTADAALTALADGFGYTCATTSTPFVAANTTTLALTGDDKEIPVALPFAVRFYGTSYTTAYVDTNGVLYFTNPTKSYFQKTSLPAATVPNNLIAPFWTDLNVDASASVHSATVGTAPHRQFVIEWRNVISYTGTSRFSFEALLGEDGTIAFNYSGLSTPDSQGGVASIGIENSDGTIGFQCGWEQPILASNRAITFQPPA